MIKILVVEDEPNLRVALQKTLEFEGYLVITANNGLEALEKFSSDQVDLIISDIMMPLLDGYDFIYQIRKVNQAIPILLLTALETINDKEKAFNLGSDDYLVKPLVMKELLLRVKALLRRHKINSEQIIVLKHTIIDFKTQTLKINNQVIELNNKEFQLLFKLLSNPETIYSREQLLNEVWGHDAFSMDRTVDTHISWLREKAPSPDFEIITVWKLGYKVVINEN